MNTHMKKTYETNIAIRHRDTHMKTIINKTNMKMTKENNI